MLSRRPSIETRALAGWLAAALLLSGCGADQTPKPAASSAVSRPAVAQAEKPVSAISPVSNAFWQHWGDGKAELSGYDLRQPRYNQVRRGVAVTIFVTEPFSASALVKADPGKHPAQDVFPVMKLNLVKDYQTGVYDYNDMTSVFSGLASHGERAAGAPAKVSFSSQEWCGHVYGQLLFRQPTVHAVQHSYFDGEDERNQDLAFPANGISEDMLLHWAREFSGPLLQPGETKRVSLLLSLAASRAQHQPLTWNPATLARSAGRERIQVPAGSFETDIYTARVENGPVRTFYVEAATPRRIIRWQSSTGEQAALLASDRMKYWEMNQEGGEHALRRLGLTRRPARTP